MLIEQCAYGNRWRFVSPAAKAAFSLGGFVAAFAAGRAEAAAVVKKFEAKNFKPEAYTLYSYAAVQIMAEGAKRANSADPKKIAEALHKGEPVKTVIGDIAFDKKGDITRPDYTVYTWKKGADGKITYVEN